MFASENYAVGADRLDEILWIVMRWLGSDFDFSETLQPHHIPQTLSSTYKTYKMVSNVGVVFVLKDIFWLLFQTSILIAGGVSSSISLSQYYINIEADTALCVDTGCSRLYRIIRIVCLLILTILHCEAPIFRTVGYSDLTRLRFMLLSREWRLVKVEPIPY